MEILQEAADATLVLALAAATGALLGWERETAHKAAGLRTHMMVALGCALFAHGAYEHSGVENVGRAIQGIAAGIGFIGAGAIIKRPEGEEVLGITTASSIWMTAAVGTAAGTGQTALAVVGAIFGYVVLRVFGRDHR